MGTRFMATVEAPIHQNIKEILVNSTEKDTIHIFRTLKNTERVYKNAVAKEVVRLEQRPGGVKFEELKELVRGDRGRRVYTEGDVDAGIWSIGITVGLIHDIPTCKELLDRIVREAEEVIQRMNNLSTAKARL